MIPTDKTAFAQLLLKTATRYHRSLSYSVLEMYWQCLKDYAFTAIKKAFLRYIKTTNGRQFMPKPSDIWRILAGGNPKKVALSAWKKVKQAIRDVGGYQSIVFDDFLIHSVIEGMGGWIALCQKTEQELGVAGLEFKRRYCRYMKYRPYQYSSHLIGLIEYHPLQQKRIPEPLFFGHPQAALMTYLEGVKPDNGLPSFRSVRSAHQLIVEAIKHLKRDDAATQNSIETPALPIASSSRRMPHEPE